MHNRGLVAHRSTKLQLMIDVKRSEVTVKMLYHDAPPSFENDIRNQNALLSRNAGNLDSEEGECANKCIKFNREILSLLYNF